MQEDSKVWAIKARVKGRRKATKKPKKGEKSYLVSPFLPKVRCKKEEEKEKQLKNKQQKNNKRGGKGKGHKTEERRKMMRKYNRYDISIL